MTKEFRRRAAQYLAESLVEYRSPMNQRDLERARASSRTIGVACLVVLLCVCVVAQMLGAPVTLLGLLNSDMLTESEPVSEDFSALTPLPEPERPGLLRVVSEFRPVRQLPVLITSVFHPPTA